MPDSLRDMTRPGYRRNMTQEEIDALYGEQGIEPTLPPFGASAGKLAADYLSIPVQQFLSELSGGVPSLLAVARWKKANLPQNLRALVESVRLAPKTDPISQRATVFHATDPDSLERILTAGEIVPDPRAMTELGAQKWSDVQRLRPLEYNKPVPRDLMEKLIERAQADQMTAEFLKEEANRRHYGGPRSFDKQKAQEAINDWLANPHSRSSPGAAADSDFALFVDNVFGPERTPQILADLGYRMGQPVKNPGVSVSRVPRVASKGSKAVSFVIDPEKAPPMRPFAEASYRKTILPDKPTWPGSMNQLFEFEDRTYNQAIPREAIREMWVDKSALAGRGTDFFDYNLQEIRDLLGQYGIPVREFETGREMHRGRVTLPDLVRKKR